MALRVSQVVNSEGHANNCFSFLLAFMEEGSTFLWKEIGDNFEIIHSRIPALKRVLEEHRNVVQVFLQFFYYHLNRVGK